MGQPCLSIRSLVEMFSPILAILGMSYLKTPVPYLSFRLTCCWRFGNWGGGVISVRIR